MAAVNPADDAAWPHCRAHPDDGRHWCDDTRVRMVGGEDAGLIDPGGRYCVPIVPANGLYAEVSIGPEAAAPGMYPLAVVKPGDDPNDPFTNTEVMYDLGLWMEGDGRLVIANTITDWMEGEYEDKPCQSRTHGFEEQMWTERIDKRQDVVELKTSRWCMVYYGMCWPCYMRPQGVASGRNGGTTTSFDASSFGLTEDNFNTNGRATGDTEAQRRAREVLASRLGPRRYTR